jgi:hypothetical protein
MFNDAHHLASRMTALRRRIFIIDRLLWVGSASSSNGIGRRQYAQ